MADNNFKEDFFGDRYSEKKDRKPRFFKKYSTHRFLPHVKIPTEYTIVIAIGVLILVIIAYAIGVERGKRIKIHRLAKSSDIMAQSLVNEGVTLTKKSENKTNLPEDTKKIEVSPEKARAKQEEKDIAGDYILYLASFRNQNYAEKEVEMLKRRGHNASFKRRGSWYQIYIAGYPNLIEARKVKKALDSQYKDSYIGKTNGAR
jgi:hypothetical protein